MAIEDALLGILLFLVFGSALLTLILSYGTNAKNGEATANPRGEEYRRQIPRFFTETWNRPRDLPGKSTNDEMLKRVQRYLENEQVLADEFVWQPSVEALYRESGRRVPLK